MDNATIPEIIRTLSDQLARNWPLYSFVTSNPLAGMEHLHFEEAVSEFHKMNGTEGYPSAEVYRQAWAKEEIGRMVVEKELLKQNISLSPEKSLTRMQQLERQAPADTLLGQLDRHMIKWLTVFLDQGSAEWEMPNREAGFYKAWLSLTRFDRSLPNRQILRTLPEEPLEAIQLLTTACPPDDIEALFRHHLFALPGWVGYIRYRLENTTDWQQAYPITLEDYLAVRLALCTLLDKELLPEIPSDDPLPEELKQLKSAWLRAMERTYQDRLIQAIESQAQDRRLGNKARPDAQLVFCIDTRSEPIRRAVENAGNYDTLGYAGFFGVAMDYLHPDKDIRHKSCPPILESVVQATEQVHPENQAEATNFNFYKRIKKTLSRLQFTLKNNIPASFGYVESTGFFYGLVMILRTLSPNIIHRIGERLSGHIGLPESFSDLALSAPASDGSPVTQELSTDKKAEIAKTAFELMGWDQFSPLVVFAGHGSQTTNNPYASSLDCGACAGNKGRHNARALANICNDRDVRQRLAMEYGIEIPKDTWFLAAEHNTTTNHIQLFDPDAPAHMLPQIDDLKKSLRTAQYYANLEQFNLSGNQEKRAAREAGRRASDWAETRPEWGLAGNASFIIGPRDLTADLNLEARSFLHSYDWRKDPDGKKLEAILQGPMVVTQWINNHYYFASVDNENFGGGTKVTQNVTGKFGVVQGNGGDLKSGLPLESLSEDDSLLQHLPLRLTVIIHAPPERVKSIITSNAETLEQLVKNEWIHLGILDPAKNTVEMLKGNTLAGPVEIKYCME